MKRFDEGDECGDDDVEEEGGTETEEFDDSEDPFEEGDDFGSDSGLDCSGFLGCDMGDDIPQIMLNNGKKVYCHEELLHEFENYKKFFGEKAIFAWFVHIHFFHFSFHFISFLFISFHFLSFHFFSFLVSQSERP